VPPKLTNVGCAYSQPGVALAGIGRYPDHERELIMIGRSPSLGQSGPWRLYGPSFSNHLRNCVIGNVRHHNSVVTPMVTACVDGRQCPLGLVSSIGRTWSAQHNVELSLE
jgi:hypothetical protein